MGVQGLQQAFVIATADYGNIGDALIYRHALDWSECAGRRSIFVGRAPAQWLTQLGLPRSDDEVYGTFVGAHRGRYRAMTAWALNLIFGRGRRSLFFDTGETPLGNKNLPRELFFLLLVIATRLRGGVVVRPPHAIRVGHSPITLAIYRISARLSQHTYFRNHRSHGLVGTGRVIPDMGFNERNKPERGTGTRRQIVVSLRGHNPIPSDEWFDCISHVATRHGFEIVVVTQVSHDQERSRELAARLGGRIVDWQPEDLVEMEKRLVVEYEKAALVISDRMHVLVYAAASGAVPAELVDNPTEKISSHFEVAGLVGVTRDAQEMTLTEMENFLEERISQATSSDKAFIEAGRKLQAVKAEICVDLK